MDLTPIVDDIGPVENILSSPAGRVNKKVEAIKVAMTRSLATIILYGGKGNKQTRHERSGKNVVGDCAMGTGLVGAC